MENDWANRSTPKSLSLWRSAARHAPCMARDGFRRPSCSTFKVPRDKTCAEYLSPATSRFSRLNVPGRYERSHPVTLPAWDPGPDGHHANGDFCVDPWFSRPFRKYVPRDSADDPSRFGPSGRGTAGARVTSSSHYWTSQRADGSRDGVSGSRDGAARTVPSGTSLRDGLRSIVGSGSAHIQPFFPEAARSRRHTEIRDVGRPLGNARDGGAMHSDAISIVPQNVGL